MFSMYRERCRDTRIHYCACTLATALAQMLLCWFSLFFTQRQPPKGATHTRRSSLSRRATPVVIAADAFDVLSLVAHFLAVVVQAHEKSDRIGRGVVADDTRPAVEVRC
jgi:hypothetical protein